MKRAFAFALLALAQTTVTPSFAEPADTDAAGASPAVDEARGHFQRGVEFYKDRDFDAALVEFTRAYQLVPNYRVLYNLAQVHLERRDYAMAMKFFREYLDTGQAEIPTQRREQVERDLAALKPKVAEIRVNSAESGAEVLINGLVISKTPMTDFAFVNAGVLQLSVRKPGFNVEVRTVTAAGGEKHELEVSLKPEGSAAPKAEGGESPAPSATTRSGPGTAFWIALGSTAALAAGAGAFAVVTQKSNSRLDDQLDTYPVNPSELDDARSDVKRNALITDILLGGAVVGAAATIYFAVSGPSAEKPHTARLGLRPLPVARGSGLSLVGEL